MNYQNIMYLLHTLKPLTDPTIYRIYVFLVCYHMLFSIAYSALLILFHHMSSCTVWMIILSITFHYLKCRSLHSASQGSNTDDNTDSGSHEAIQSSFYFSEHFKSPWNNDKQKLCLRKSYQACKARHSRVTEKGWVAYWILTYFRT